MFKLMTIINVLTLFFVLQISGITEAMAGNQLSFEERKFVLKCYWRTENATEVQRRFTREFAKPPPTRRTIAHIRDKFEADGTIQNINYKRSGRPRTSTSPGNLRIPWCALSALSGQ